MSALLERMRYATPMLQEIGVSACVWCGWGQGGAGGIEKRGPDKISPLEPRNPSFLSDGHMGAEPGFGIQSKLKGRHE